MVQAELAASLAAENEALTEDFNHQVTTNPPPLCRPDLFQLPLSRRVFFTADLYSIHKGTEVRQDTYIEA